MKLSNYVTDYLEYKDKVWTRATLLSEQSRLKKYSYLLDSGMDAASIYKTLKGQGLGPYTLKTAFIRLGNFADWIMENKPGVITKNIFKEFTTTNKQIFRNSYKKETLATTYDEAIIKISSIENAVVKQHAFYLLQTGLRISESYNLEQREDGQIYVIGKGGKQRRIFTENLPQSLASVTTLRRALKKVNLKPHTLRKLYATRLLTKGGISTHELCKIMGWSNIETAMSYLQSRKDEELQGRIQGVL